jgi:hypothetical protein
MLDVTLLDQLSAQDLDRVSVAFQAPTSQATAAELIGRLRADTPAPRFRVVRAPTLPPMPEDADDETSDPGATVVPLARHRSMH